MSECIMRVSGKRFQVDKFLEYSSLVPCRVFRKGQPRSSGVPRRRKVEKESGFNIVVASGRDLKAQTRKVIAFLKRNRLELRRLRKYRGVESVTLDFGLQSKGKVAYFAYLSPEFLRLAAGLDFGIEISQYSTS
jgi:hypothetical protein